MITHLNGIQGSRVKMFSRDGGISPGDFFALETEVNNWLSANPSFRVYNISIQLIERIQPNPDLYTQWIMITYKD